MKCDLQRTQYTAAAILKVMLSDSPGSALLSPSEKFLITTMVSNFGQFGNLI
jgi:hypothetical protein